MMEFTRKIGFVAAVAGCALLLASCEKEKAEPQTYEVTLAPGSTVALRDGPMADVNDCIARNNTDALAPGGAAITCAWMHSVPYTGMPPGVAAYFAFEWPNARVTVRNGNSMILLTEVCIRLQFGTQGAVENACGALAVGPMGLGQTNIFIRPQLEQLGIHSDEDIANLSGTITQVRYIQIVEPVEE